MAAGGRPRLSGASPMGLN